MKNTQPKRSDDDLGYSDKETLGRRLRRNDRRTEDSLLTEKRFVGVQEVRQGRGVQGKGGRKELNA